MTVADTVQFPPLGQLLPVAAESEKSVPTPVSDTLWGLLDASSVMVTDALRVPVAVGWRVTAIEQFAPADSVAGLAGQVLVLVKSPLFVPVIAIFEIVSGALPVLVRVTLCEAVLLPTGWLLKVRFVPERLAPGPVTVGACKSMENVLLGRLSMARSSLPSPLKSPIATSSDPPVLKSSRG